MNSPNPDDQTQHKTSAPALPEDLSGANKSAGHYAGLSSASAAQKLAQEGSNELPRPAPRTLARMAGEVAREPMFQLLSAAVVLYLFLGDLGEASALLAMLAVIVGITLVQEHRTERVLTALRDMTNPRAWVWRDGQQHRVAGTELVVGDVLVLTEGERVPADARLLAAADLLVDESLLTGESLPVAKSVGATHNDASTARTSSSVFAGSLVVAGQGVAEVVATGARSQIGRIGTVLSALEPQATPLHQQIRQLVRWFSVFAAGISVLVAALYVWTRHDWLGALLAGITTAMALLPQEFLLILTVFMAMGAWRLSQHRVLTRRATSIETLGAATVLCTDKTGTLTQNRMAIATLMCGEGAALQRWQAATTPNAPAENPLPTAFHELLRIGILASEPEPFDPMERAFHALGRAQLPTLPQGTLVHEYGLAPGWPVMTHVWQMKDSSRPTPTAAAVYLIAAKGAPETVLTLCRLPLPQQQALLDEASHLAEQGRRVLAVARATFRDEPHSPVHSEIQTHTPMASAAQGPLWPADPRGFAFEFLGLVALADPLRDEVPAAVQECRHAGIRVLMMTGDHPGTALAIARQAGLGNLNKDALLTGSAIDALDDTALCAQVAHTTVCARVTPQQKLRIVQALKTNGEVVAMTGDGVNDAPSLKAAHMGIAMGQRGTDVAREAASLVLLDDDFQSLVHAVRLGRRIYDNLHKALRFVLAVHVPIAGLTLLPLMWGWPLLFMPIHIAFLEMVINPVCSMVFEAEDEEADVMTRPPRAPGRPLFSVVHMAASVWQGGLVFVAVAAWYGFLLHSATPPEQARAATFLALVLANIGLIFLNRSSDPRLSRVLGTHNRALWVSVLATLALLTAVLSWAPLRAWFLFDLLSPTLFISSVAVAVGVFLLLWAQPYAIKFFKLCR